MTAVLELKGVCKAYGAVTVAEDLSYRLGTGEALGVIGPNGAGKTSMFNLITGTIRADSGQILLKGEDITRQSAARRCRSGIARSFQVPQPFTGMSVFENTLVAAIHGTAGSLTEANAHCLEILELTGLIDKANEPAGKLTLLGRKRLELARALCARPRILLLDEIAGGLTEKECHALVATINTIRKTGLSIIWIEHIVHALLSVVDRLIVIDFGRKIADGAPKETMASQAVQEIYMGVDADA
ncbi:ABC transporter ATP-binding protein [Roseibium sediminicola]|uniref:ABC transporter ATP-binding protein n=1 Tax=Roseibium sediminicola TaxID=2933272 RepID=A0ABT0GYW1_9HYPH|nr:ABC transporter ATP-binding protein [Roseibium sp. CAU 1639]MCK7614612.1 ABC transporter ATP-binding protein [Roseibium sp. CAU 1639]